MRFSELHPCDGCGEGLRSPFLRVDITNELVDQAEARKRHGLDCMFPGAPGLAASFHGDPSDATKSVHVARALLCMQCAAALLDAPGISTAVLRDQVPEKKASGGSNG